MMGAVAKETDRDLLLELARGQSELKRQMSELLQLHGVHSKKNRRGRANHGSDPSNNCNPSLTSNSSECGRIKQWVRRDKSMQEAIQHYITELAKSLPFNASNIPDLIIAQGIANESETAKIRQLSTTEDQVSALVAHVLNCDYDGMDKFLEIISKDYSHLEKKIREMFDTLNQETDEATMPCAVCELKAKCDVKHVYNYLFEKHMITPELHRIIAYMKCPVKDPAAAWDALLEELSWYPNQLAIDVLVQALGLHDGHQNATITLMLKRLFRKNRPLTCRCENPSSSSSSPASTLPFALTTESMERVYEDMATSNCDNQDMITEIASNRNNQDLAINIASNWDNQNMASEIASNRNNQDIVTKIASNRDNQDMATNIARNRDNQGMATNIARNRDNQDMATNIASNRKKQDMVTEIASNRDNHDMATNIARNHDNEDMATNIARNRDNQDMATNIAGNRDNRDMATNIASNRDNQDMATNIASNHKNQNMATNIACNRVQDMVIDTANYGKKQNMATDLASNCQIGNDRSVRSENDDFVMNTGEKALEMTSNDNANGLHASGISPSTFIKWPIISKIKQAQKAPGGDGKSQTQYPVYPPRRNFQSKR